MQNEMGKYVCKSAVVYCHYGNDDDDNDYNDDEEGILCETLLKCVMMYCRMECKLTKYVDEQLLTSCSWYGGSDTPIGSYPNWNQIS